MEILAHDITVQEGKTYRYAVRYKLYNPLFHSVGLATKEVSQRLFIAGVDPAADKDANSAVWSAPVTLDPSTYAFVTHVNFFSNQVSFAAFEWKNGKWTESNPRVTPGDLISKGGRWTLVDVRKDPRTNDVYVLVLDDQGNLQRREEKEDQGNSKFNELKNVAAAPAAMAN